jgi:hypothetical protein
LVVGISKGKKKLWKTVRLVYPCKKCL